MWTYSLALCSCSLLQTSHSLSVLSRSICSIPNRVQSCDRWFELECIFFNSLWLVSPYPYFPFFGDSKFYFENWIFFSKIAKLALCTKCASATVNTTVKPLNTAVLGTGEKPAVFRKRRYWESCRTNKLFGTWNERRYWGGGARRWTEGRYWEGRLYY